MNKEVTYLAFITTNSERKIVLYQHQFITSNNIFMYMVQIHSTFVEPQIRFQFIRLEKNEII